jgi:hypothetical protein
MKSWIFGATLLLAVFPNPAVFAAKAITPKAQLEKDATHVVVGKVRSISSTKRVKGQWGFTNYVAEIAIDRVEKGEGLKAGGIVQVRYHAQGWLGSGTLPPYDSGHSPTPKQDDSVRAYLVNHGYNGAGYTTDGQYDVFYKTASRSSTRRC